MNNSENNIWWEGDKIFYYSAPSTHRKIALSDIIIIGEFTNQDGPVTDDYFLVFIVKSFEGWYQLSFYSNGMDQFIKTLNTKLGTNIQFQLFNSTDFKSRVMYPNSLANIPLFEFTNVEKPFWRFWDNEVNQSLTPDVVTYITNSK